MPPTAQRLVFVLLDGLRLDGAGACPGYVQAEAAAAGRSCIPVASELPSLSRPLYETLMTGVPPVCGGGPGSDETLVPFRLLGAGRSPEGIALPQTRIASTACALMGVPHDGMSANPALL